MNFLPSKKFERHFKKTQKNVKRAFTERVGLFEQNKFHPLLNNHELNPPYADCRSFDVTGDIRVIFKEVDNDNCILIDIGPHSELYE